VPRTILEEAVHRAHAKWLQVTQGAGTRDLFSLEEVATADGRRWVVAVHGHPDQNVFLVPMLLKQAQELGLRLRREDLPGGPRYCCTECLGVAEGIGLRPVKCACRAQYQG
jgi:hypothetical protein